MHPILSLFFIFLFTLTFSPYASCADNETPLPQASPTEKNMELQKEVLKQAQELQKKYREDASRRRDIFGKKNEALRKMRSLSVKRTGVKDEKEKESLDAQINQLKKDLYDLDEEYAKESVASAEHMLSKSQERLDNAKRRLADIQQNKSV